MTLEPIEIVEVLNIIYSEFDSLSDLLQVHKVETVGQVYMAVVGCPVRIKNHADMAAHFALAAQAQMSAIRQQVKQMSTVSAMAASLTDDALNENFKIWSAYV